MKHIRLLLAALTLFLGGCASVSADDRQHVATPSPIPITPGDAPTVVRKVRVTDSRAVRGFIGAPVDGSTQSGAWDGKMWEYPMRFGGVGVQYTYLNADGLHLTLDDDRGFNAIVMRGGARAKLYRDVQHYDRPETGKLVHQFPGAPGGKVARDGGGGTSRAWFEQPVRTGKVSFFDVGDGLIADVSFFRVTRGGDAAHRSAPPLPAPLPLNAEPFAEETSLAAVGVNFTTTGATDVTVRVVDPLNPRLTLHDADYHVTAAGDVRIVCDFPDQVVPAGKTLTVAVEPTQADRVTDVALEQYCIPKAQAIDEALAHRKFILHAVYTPVSEARPWNTWNNPGDDEEYFTRPPETGDALQDRLRPWVREIVMTLEQCRALDADGNDEIVRQFHQWIYRKILTRSPGGMPPFPTRFQRIDGVPEWASLLHQSWMQARDVPRWWLDNRLAPNGEFGGLLGDDTDMYQNFAPFPMLERDPRSVGGRLLDAAARMAELLEVGNLEHGMNLESMDPLHAYEEGLNHEALMAHWNYGDPIYLERCMAAARSTEPQTMITARGHRHFRCDMLGVAEITKPRPPDREHGAHCLMWHPTLMLTWYNRHPRAMTWLTEWGDGWLQHMKPGEHATHVKLPDDVTLRAEELPFQGGWGMTGSVFTALADLTGDARFIRPYTDYFTARGNTGVHLAEIYQMGMLPGGRQSLERVKGSWPAVLYNLANTGPWNASLYATGSKQPLIAALKKDIEELQRFPHMYTTVECFTDRVFLYAAINPSIAYTGGYTTRNKLNLTYAVSWDGFGTDYAALVTAATNDRLKVLLCNVSDEPIAGTARLWRLDPGEYELTFGPDANNDDQPDRAERVETLTITKGDEIALSLPPKTVHVLELKQLRRSGPIYNRADLALAPRDLKIVDGKITGAVHNIGVADVDDVVVALLDRDGNAIATESLGRLAAPLDLNPRRLAFQFSAPAGASDLTVVVDPAGRVSEIFEGNNRLPVTPPGARPPARADDDVNAMPRESGS